MRAPVVFLALSLTASGAAAQEGLRADYLGIGGAAFGGGHLHGGPAVVQFVDGSSQGQGQGAVIELSETFSTTLIIPADGSSATFLDARIMSPTPIVISGVVDLGFDGSVPYELTLTTAEMTFDPIESSLSPDLEFQSDREMLASQHVRIAGTLTVNGEPRSVDISSSFRPDFLSVFSVQAFGQLNVAADLSTIEMEHGLIAGSFGRYVLEDDLEEALIFSDLIAGHHVELALDLLFVGIFSGPAATTTVADSDQDGRPDLIDNCPEVANLDQEDTDNDGLGDACNDAADPDGDEFSDALDNCPNEFNPAQEDGDSDGVGDLCDPFPNDPDNNLAQCSSDLGDCQIDVISCESDAAQCSADLSLSQASLTVCTGDLSSCIGTATQLEADLLQTQGDLAQARSDITLLQADVTQLASDLASTEAALAVATADADEDGVRDTFDLCPETSLDVEIDGFGCSLPQFCSGIDPSDKAGRGSCNSSDWGNDEPGDEAEDCRARQGECVPLISG